MTTYVVSDVHGAADALSRVAPEGSRVLVLGDLVNAIDYRTREGIIPDAVGRDVVDSVVTLRAQGRFAEARAVWEDRPASSREVYEKEVARGFAREYEAVCAALARYESFVTYGNVDRVDMLRGFLPDSARFVDGEAVEISGLSVGFAGGGVPSIGSSGEVSHEEMATKLEELGPVDVLCTHVPPAVESLSTDLFGPAMKGSMPVLEYLRRHQPGLHLFGDVHQPRATTWRLGATTCHNVGYFRATGRAFLLP